MKTTQGVRHNSSLKHIITALTGGNLNKFLN